MENAQVEVWKMDWTGNVFSFFSSKLKYFQKIIWWIYLQIQDIKTLDLNSQWKLLLLHLGTESLFVMVRNDYIVVMILCSFVSFLRSLLGRPTISKFYNTVKFLLIVIAIFMNDTSAFLYYSSIVNSIVNSYIWALLFLEKLLSVRILIESMLPCKIHSVLNMGLLSGLLGCTAPVVSFVRLQSE